MVRKLKFHEQKLLKKVDFISWKVDNNLNEVKVMKKYYIQKREDYTKYNKLSREIREIASKIKDLDAYTEFRTEASAQLLEKLYQMGLIPTRWDLALANGVSASSFCRRRLPVVMKRTLDLRLPLEGRKTEACGSPCIRPMSSIGRLSVDEEDTLKTRRLFTVIKIDLSKMDLLYPLDKMSENLKEATKFIEQGHVRVGPEVVKDPAFLVTRSLEDFVTWVDGSAIRKHVMEYNEMRDDFDML